MLFPSVVVKASGGVPYVEVASGAPAYTVVASGAPAITLVDSGAPPIALFNPNGSPYLGGFDPLSLFAEGEQGGWYDPSDTSTLFQERTGASATTPSIMGGPVGTMLDKSGRGNHLTASVDAARPILRSAGSSFYLEFDGVDDALRSANGASNVGTLSLFWAGTATKNGSVHACFPHAPATHTSPFFRFALSRNGVGNLYSNVNGTQTTAATALSTDIAVLSLFSADGDAYRNATLVNNGPSATVTYPSAVPFIIGSNGAGGEALGGSFYGCILLGRDATADERTTTRSYLASKSGI